ncbi:hypothetical protein TheveDRAFT_0380 [Thermanaerovibrio velox DSM 12556]|uniref:DUF4139 domain-containing protein n=1 Tax=Thermanaerovibrio velox DSM 12556 TaxID=926567 RepID=H0UPK0_9BACT|nr:DUF4139 domain-containing protein [Thermanaerovibrio velox]EHM09547.1 hypothetical protein TheveDRAFT_0380 [Thermanaerovibrio velox DSM 12556]
MKEGLRRFAGRFCCPRGASLPRLMAAGVMLFLMAPGSSSAFDVKSASEAHVYPGGALAVFKGPVNRQEEVLLTSSYNRDSISVTMEGGTLSSVSIRQERIPGWVPPALSGDAKELEGLKRQIRELKLAVAAREVALRAFDAGAPKGGPSAQWEAKRIKMQGEMMSWQDRLQGLSARAEKLREEMAQRGPKGGDLLNRVVIRGNGTAKISAFTEDASWRTRYRADVDPSGKVVLTEELLISQKTGLDWDGPIVCHTASPKDVNWNPEISPWVVSFSAPAVMLRASMLKGAPELMDALNPSFEASTEDLTFTAKGLVPGTGEEVSLVSGRFNLQGSVDVTVIPMASQTAFMEVTTSPLDRIIPGGEASVSVGGVPTGKVTIPFTPKGEGLRFSGGKVPGVTSSREEAVMTRGSEGDRDFVKGGTVIRVFNGLGKTLTVTLKDRVPFPADGSIRVSYSCSMREDSYDRGILTWKLELPPGSSREINVDYKVTYPKGRKLDL